jgi:peptide/nickel transport system substrate-binding protein
LAKPGRTLILAGVVLFLWGCVKAPPPEEQKGTIRIGTTSAVRAANILKDTDLGLFARISNPSLMTMNPQGEIRGQLVDRPLSSQGGRVWTFRLKEDLFWSDGKPVTSADVAFSIRLTGWNNPYAYWIRDTLEETQIPDSRTVIFRFKKPYSRLPFEFATHNILPRHRWEALEDPNTFSYEGPYLGCGPYVLHSARPDAGLLIFKENPQWRGMRPQIKTIEIHLYKNIDVLCLALEKGEIDIFYDYVSSYPYANLGRLEASGEFGLIERPDTGLVYLGFNIREGPMASLELREAVVHALDYEELVRLDLLGHGRTAHRGFVPPGFPHFINTPPLLHEPETSRKLLREAGYRDIDDDGFLEDPAGGRVELRLPTRQRYTRTAELIGDYLGRIGLRVAPRIVDTSTWIALKENFSYDLTISRTTPWGMFMHASWATGYFDSRRTGEGVLRSISDPAFHRLCDGLLSTEEEGAKKKLAASIQHYYSRNLPAAALYWSHTIIPHKKTFSGWVVDPLYGLYNIDTFLNLKAEERP